MECKWLVPLLVTVSWVLWPNKVLGFVCLERGIEPNCISQPGFAILSLITSRENIEHVYVRSYLYRSVKMSFWKRSHLRIRSNSGKLNFYLLWHRLKSVMWYFFPSCVERRKKIILINLLDFPQGVQYLSLWKKQQGILTRLWPSSW